MQQFEGLLRQKNRHLATLRQHSPLATNVRLLLWASYREIKTLNTPDPTREHGYSVNGIFIRVVIKLRSVSNRGIVRDLDPLLLSRIQFAFVVSFHAIFSRLHDRAGVLRCLAGSDCLSNERSCLSKTLAVSGSAFLRLFSAWAWSPESSWRSSSGPTGACLPYSAANFLGPVLSYEVVTAFFFLEATFLGGAACFWSRQGAARSASAGRLHGGPGERSSRRSGFFPPTAGMHNAGRGRVC